MHQIGENIVLFVFDIKGRKKSYSVRKNCLQKHFTQILAKNSDSVPKWVILRCTNFAIIFAIICKACDLRLRFLVNGIVRLVAMRLLYGACDAIFSICD